MLHFESATLKTIIPPVTGYITDEYIDPVVRLR
jgi:hypothetical protein